MSEIIKNNYEAMLILSASLTDEETEQMLEKVKALISKNGTLGEVDVWGKRKFAYLINDESEGTYVLINFESGAEFPAELERVAKITDGILRILIIKKD